VFSHLAVVALETLHYINAGDGDYSLTALCRVLDPSCC
jgi:hypothetical protein